MKSRRTRRCSKKRCWAWLKVSIGPDSRAKSHRTGSAQTSSPEQATWPRETPRNPPSDNLFSLEFLLKRLPARKASPHLGNYLSLPNHGGHYIRIGFTPRLVRRSFIRRIRGILRHAHTQARCRLAPLRHFRRESPAAAQFRVANRSAAKAP